MPAPMIFNPHSNQEADLLLRYTEGRVIKKNKNLLAVFTGPTGSGKSYGSLRFAELWYRKRFNLPFPPHHICFSVYEVMNLLNKGELKRGDVIILEEAGANMGALDFQSRVSKIFSYVLQSFRSMNLVLIMNLPYLSMLNKQARMLLHVNFVTYDIDKQRKVGRYKVYFHQVNQQTGKIYPKNMRARTSQGVHKVRMFELGIPSPRLVEQYEEKKKNFLGNMVEDFIEELTKEYAKKRRKEAGELPPLTKKQEEVYVLFQQGLSGTEIAKKLNVSDDVVSKRKKGIKKKGYVLD